MPDESGSRPIVLVVESDVTPGKLDELVAVVSEVAKHCAATEPGLHRYDWFVSEDGASIRVLEEYADSDALRFHVQNYASFMPALAECRTMKSMTVLGEPDDALRELLVARGAAVLGPLPAAGD